MCYFNFISVDSIFFVVDHSLYNLKLYIKSMFGQKVHIWAHFFCPAIFGYIPNYLSKVKTSFSGAPYDTQFVWIRKSNIFSDHQTPKLVFSACMEQEIDIRKCLFWTFLWTTLVGGGSIYVYTYIM